MAKRVKITNQGLALLGSSSQATGQYYWIGYYALAYVPNLWKTPDSTVTLPPIDTCNNVNGTPDDIIPDNITSSMTRLTEYGDVIYNIWQGDLNGTGYAGGVSDGSAGGDLFGLTMYDNNMKKHYRYVLDENGNNTLVAWVNDPTKVDGSMKGKHVYKGTDAFTYSEMPIPAPLYYLGDPLGKDSVNDYFDQYPTFEDEDYNGSKIYPYIVSNISSDGSPIKAPKVSTDFRGYSDSKGNPAVLPFNVPGAYFDSSEIPAAGIGFDETSWFAGNTTFGVGTTDDDYYYCMEFWKLHTISNFNRFHAPVDSVGHVLQSDLSNRNMAKVTKFFPISNYKVINTETKFTSTSQAIEVATAIKIGIDIDLSPSTLGKGFDDAGNLDANSNVEFFNAYSDANIDATDPLDQYGQSIYKSVHTSFKFNRIGVYAVPMRTAAYVADEGFGVDNTNTNKKLQFQINPDEEPVLFAVIDWDNTVILSDSGDGIHQISAEVDINLESPDDSEDTALIRDASIFYNLYQDDAQTWYQNQLIANASTSNALTEFGLELANIKNKKGESGGCCPQPDLSDLFALKNHSHNFMINLKDANNAVDGGVKGIDTKPEYTIVDSLAYKMGLNSVTLGLNTSVSSDYSTIANGENSYINRDSHYSFIGAGKSNIITRKSIESAIMAGESNSITNSKNSLIGTAKNSSINSSIFSVILVAERSSISGDPSFTSYDVLLGGLNNLISESKFAFVANGSDNVINNSNYSSINSGFLNSITEKSLRSFIGTGNTNSIYISSDSAIIAGDNNQITTSLRSFIGTGYYNYIGSASSDSFIGAGYTNKILVNSPQSFIGGGYMNKLYGVGSFIGGGYQNEITNTVYATIGGGKFNRADAEFAVIGGGVSNYIGVESPYSGIFSGIGHSILSSDGSVIAGGVFNHVTNSIYAGILGGHHNYIEISNYSAILGGFDNLIQEYNNVGIFGNNIKANRSNAFMVNSLTLYDNTMELKDKTPHIGEVLRVSKVTNNNLAEVDWGRVGFANYYIDVDVKFDDYIMVSYPSEIYQIRFKDSTVAYDRDLIIDHDAMGIGDMCLLNIIGDPTCSQTLTYNGTASTPINKLTIYNNSNYAFIAVKINNHSMVLIGDQSGYISI